MLAFPFENRTSTVLLWLQNGQSKIASSFGGGGLAMTFEDLRFPILKWFKKFPKINISINL